MPWMRWAGIATAALVACSPTVDCPTEGCRYGLGLAPGVVLDVSEPIDVDASTLTVCLGDECDEVAFWAAQGSTQMQLLAVVPGAEDGDEVAVTLSTSDGDLTGSGTMRSERPNGPDCGPTCTYAEVFLAAG